MRKKAIGIMTDSHSGIGTKEAKELAIRVLPMPFCIDTVSYYEDVTITREAFYQKLKEGVEVSTSQPSPQEVMDVWDDMLKEYEQIIYIPISSGLSGSCQTANMLAQEEAYDGHVFVVDNGRVATPQHRSVLDALELAQQGYSAEQIKHALEKTRDQMNIYIGVNTLEYLKKGGRIKPAVAVIGTLLSIKPILQFDVGTLDIYRKCRSFSAARKDMIAAMKHDLETKFREQYERGEVYLLAASSAEKDVTEDWIKEIQAAFPDMEVMCDNLSLGVSCHIGYGGLGIGCSCKPHVEDES